MLTHWASIAQSFPSIAIFQLPHMQSDLNYIFNCSTITFFYIFVSSPLVIFCCSTFCSSCHLFTHSLFYLSYLFLFHFFFPYWFFLACYFVYFNLQGFGYLLNFFAESVVKILFFLFLYHLLDFSFFITILMLWHNISIAYCILCSAEHVPASVNIPVYAVLSGSLNILFRAFPCILFIHFSLISSFFYVSPCFYTIRAGIKQTLKSFSCTLISSFLTWFLDPIIYFYLLPHTSVLILQCTCLDFPLHLLWFPSMYFLDLWMFPAFTCS